MQLKTFLMAAGTGEFASLVSGLPINTSTFMGNLIGAALVTVGSAVFKWAATKIQQRKGGNNGSN